MVKNKIVVRGEDQVRVPIRTNVFKGKNVRRGVFLSMNLGVSLEGLRHKPFGMTLYN